MTGKLTRRAFLGVVGGGAATFGVFSLGGSSNHKHAKPQHSLSAGEGKEAETETATESEQDNTATETRPATFVSEYIDDPFTGRKFDPEIVDKQFYDDGLWRVVIGDSPANETQLHATPDFSNYTLVSRDILPGVNGSGQVAGIEVLNDGTRVVMVSTGSVTDLYTGPNLQNLSRAGEFCPEPDGGTFYDSATDTLHYYPENAAAATGVSSDRLSHWTAPGDDLLNATQHGIAFDATEYPWHTGDPEIIKVQDWYYMFMDNTSNHPKYHIALAAGQTLDDFTLIDSNITPDHYGGDIALVPRSGYFEGLTEYSGNQRNIGHWRLQIEPR